MKKDRICKYCGKLFENIEGKVFSNHVRWCDKNPKDKSETKEKIKKSLRKYFDNKIGKLTTFNVKCFKCGNEFQIEEYELKFSNDKKYYCSRSCANSHVRTDESKERTSRTILSKYEHLKKYCKKCGKEYSYKLRSKFCSKECRNLYKFEQKLNNAVTDIEKEKILIKKYRSECSFKFNLKDYPNKFDFKLIEKYGWYKPKNRGDNLNGISRDHMYSIMDGYRNKIDPKIISHPANCRLVRHNENVSKLDKSILTLDELLKRIEDWDK